MAPAGPSSPSMLPLSSGPSPIPSPVPTTQVPPAPSTSVVPPQATATGTATPPKGPTLAPVTSQPQLSIVPTVDASVELGKSHSQAGSGNPSWFGWIRGTVSSVSHKVAEKAKNSMDSMITTLDPQMKEYICVLPPDSGGDVDLVVASDKEVKVGAVREAFQAVFGKATVSGMSSEATSVAAQPVGFASALTAGEERINSLRSGGRVHPQQPVVAVENFIVELTPGFWYDMGLLLIDDPGQDILLQTYTQVTPIPAEYVTQARASTPEDYPLKSSGFATTIGEVASQVLQVHHSQWQETVCGVPRREMVTLAARVLASLYKAQLPQSF
ncbi:protein PRRC1-like [Oratosquilla oratoria]|uniref:protein PRRC1-like n=1 Tax=Oratosquilla oratoria TaxID=337810 RepID=UPI003F7630AF